MRGDGFGTFLLCWAALVFVPLALYALNRLDPRRLRSLVLPLLLFAGCCLYGELPRWAMHCEGALVGFAPTAFLLHAFGVPLSSL